MENNPLEFAPMTPRQLLDYYDGKHRDAAYHIGYSAAAIYDWIKRRKIPYRAQLAIEAATAGALKAVRK